MEKSAKQNIKKSREKEKRKRASLVYSSHQWSAIISPDNLSRIVCASLSLPCVSKRLSLSFSLPVYVCKCVWLYDYSFHIIFHPARLLRNWDDQ